MVQTADIFLMSTLGFFTVDSSTSLSLITTPNITNPQLYGFLLKGALKNVKLPVILI